MAVSRSDLIAALRELADELEAGPHDVLDRIESEVEHIRRKLDSVDLYGLQSVVEDISSQLDEMDSAVIDVESAIEDARRN